MPTIDASVIESGIESTLAKFFVSLQLPEGYGGKGLNKKEAKEYIYNFLYKVATEQYFEEEKESEPGETSPDNSNITRDL